MKGEERKGLRKNKERKKQVQRNEVGKEKYKGKTDSGGIWGD